MFKIVYKSKERVQVGLEPATPGSPEKQEGRLCYLCLWVQRKQSLPHFVPVHLIELVCLPGVLRET